MIDLSSLIHRLPQGRYTIATGLIWHNNGRIYDYVKDHWHTT